MFDYDQLAFCPWPLERKWPSLTQLSFFYYRVLLLAKLDDIAYAPWLYHIINLMSAKQTIIRSGFALLSLSCGLISTITSKSHKVELIIFMLMAGVGAGQVRILSPSIISSLNLPCHHCLDSTNIHDCSTSQCRQKGYVRRDWAQNCRYS